jgi:hypothetical protein
VTLGDGFQVHCQGCATARSEVVGVVLVDMDRLLAWRSCGMTFGSSGMMFDDTPFTFSKTDGLLPCLHLCYLFNVVIIVSYQWCRASLLLWAEDRPVMLETSQNLNAPMQITPEHPSPDPCRFATDWYQILLKTSPSV